MREDGRDGVFLGNSGYFWVILGIIVMTALYPELPSSTQCYPVLPTLPTPVMLSEAKHLSVGANVERPC